MSKKLALLLYRYFPYGGLQKDFMGVTQELLSRGHHIEVYTRSWQGQIPSDIKVVQFGEKGISNYSKNNFFVKQVSKALEISKPDLVLGFNKMPGLDLYFASDTCFAKQSQTKHFLQKYTRRFQQSMQFENEVFSTTSSTKSFLLNDNQLNDFEQFYSTPQHRMTLIPPGIDQDWSSHKPLNIQEKLKIPIEDKIMLFVGSDFSRKGLDRAILSLNHILKQKIAATLIVIGNDQRDPYNKMIKENTLEEKIHFIGPSDEVASFMKSSDLLIHPAREEAAGNIIIEAIVSGLPSLVTEAVGFSSEVLKFKSGVVLTGEFNQENFNLLLEETISEAKLLSIKDSICNLSDSDYFFSRFKYVADYIENEC